MIIWIAPVLGFLRSALPYALLFLRSIPDLLAPKPTSVGIPYTPPFNGGQCDNETYHVGWSYIDPTGVNPDYSPFYWEILPDGTVDGNAPIITAPIYSIVGANRNNFRGTLITSKLGERFFQLGYDPSGGITPVGNIKLLRVDRLADDCGNLSNPIPPPSVADDGLFSPTNPKIGDDSGTLNPAAIVLSPALPLALVGAILGGYAAAMAAAQAALSALDAIKKVAEGLDALKSLWEKLKEFLDDWEKNRPKKRDVVRQTYGQIVGDGAIDFFPNNNTKFQAIQLDVVITNIPIGFGRYFGSLSPSRYRFRELGYIAFYSVNQGILETHSIQFKRTSYQIPELAVGFIYHLGLDEQIRGYSFGTFSVEKT